MNKSCKGSKCIAVLEQYINEIDTNQDTSRHAKFNRAILCSKSLSDVDWKNLSIKLKKMKNEICNDNIAIPTALQVRVDNGLEGMLTSIEKRMMKALNLQKLQTRYEIEILWLSYFEHLKKEIINTKIESTTPKQEMTYSQMMETITQMMLLNRKTKEVPYLIKIREILTEWKEQNKF